MSCLADWGCFPFALTRSVADIHHAGGDEDVLERKWKEEANACSGLPFKSFTKAVEKFIYQSFICKWVRVEHRWGHKPWDVERFASSNPRLQASFSCHNLFIAVCSIWGSVWKRGKMLHILNIFRPAIKVEFSATELRALWTRHPARTVV